MNRIGRKSDHWHKWYKWPWTNRRNWLSSISYTGEQPAAAAAHVGIQLEAIKDHEAKHGFVLLPRRCVVERSFAWRALPTFGPGL